MNTTTTIGSEQPDLFEGASTPVETSGEPITLLDWALDALRRGYYVLPCLPQSKRPAISNGVNGASNDETQIREWWAANPNYNPAIALGPSNLVVFDFDTIQPFPDLAPTFTVQTGRVPVNGIAGIQMYYSGKCKPHGHYHGGGEVRSIGQYVMAPGSIHPNGNVYKIISDVPVVPSHEQDEEVAPPRNVAPAISTTELNNFAAYILEAFDESGIEYERGLAYHGGIKWLIRCPWAEEHTQGEDFDSSSAVILWPDGKRIYECMHGHCEGVRQWEQLRDWMQKKAGHFLRFGDPVGGVVTNTTNAKSNSPTPISSHSTTAVDKAAEKAAAQAQAIANWRSSFRSVGELEDGDIKMLINGFMPHGMNFIGALPGEAKTLFALSITKALTTGRPLLGNPVWSVPTVTPVIYMIPEVGARAFKKRLINFQIPNDENLFVCRTISEGGTLQLSDPILKEAVRVYQPVVILDTLIRFSQADDENASMQNKKLGDDIVELMHMGAVAVISLHHAAKSMRKDGMTQENVLRGTGDLAALADVVYGLKRDDSLYDNGSGPLEIEIRCLKPRDLEHPPLPFRIAASRRGEYQPGYLGSGIESIINATGDFQLLARSVEHDRLEFQLNSVITDNPEISINGLSRILEIPASKIQKIVKRLGWAKPRGIGHVWTRTDNQSTAVDDAENFPLFRKQTTAA